MSFLSAIYCFFITCNSPHSTGTVPIKPGVLSWGESRDEWSKFLMHNIDAKFYELDQARDTTYFCPNYKELKREEKIKVWSELFVAIAYYESNYNPGSRYFEKTMGYYSEGLYQLSPIDNAWTKCRINKISVLEPLPNIECAVSIMQLKVKLYGKIVLKNQAYWAVIKEGSRYNKLELIKSAVQKSAPLCIKK